MKNAVAIGVIGCGNISDAYFRSLPFFPDVRLAAASDLVMERAKAKAEQYGFRAMTTEELLNDPEIRLVINLTTPEFHTAVNKRILMAGKHAYTEKPFGLDREAGREVLALAASKGLRTGGAPDTFLGGAHQTCRRLVDAGAIGKVVAGTAFMQCHGHESWHPNPAFYYRRGGGPLFDMGPYYLTALVNLLGPVAEVAAFGGRAFDEREITAPAATEKSCKVEVDTHIAAVLRFASGALVNLAMSFDVWKHSLPCIELHGTAGSLSVPDPNCFGGEVRLFQPHLAEWAKLKLTHGCTDNMRGIGAADLARSLSGGVPARACGELAFHVLDVMCGISDSARTGAFVKVQSTCERPAPLPVGLRHGQLELEA